MRERFTRDWLVGWLSSVLIGLFASAFVVIAGGPGWAGVGFGLLAYLVTLHNGNS